MTSHADDSSIEDNTSSIGDSTWDLVDDGSGVSDDEDRLLSMSRQRTPSTDGLEPEPESGGSLEENVTSDESQSIGSVHNQEAFASPQPSSNSETHESRSAPSIDPMARSEGDMEDTRTDLRQNLSDQYPLIQPFRFSEHKYANTQGSEFVEVRHFLRAFSASRDKLNQACQDFELSPVPESLVGTVRMKMSSTGLEPKQTYKILFVGPSQAKELIMQKLGSALASSLEMASAGSTEGLAHFTVVPISSFGDGSSPEVLLVNSLGIDMTVDDCRSATFIKEGAVAKSSGQVLRSDCKNVWTDNISLELSGGKTVGSYWDPSKGVFQLYEDYSLPDIAIVCLSGDEDIAKKHTRLLTRSFMIRHGVPVIMIALEPEWKKPIPALTLDLRTPHFCLETYSNEPESTQVLKRLPVDLETFLAIDSAQMGRNLACIAYKVPAAHAISAEAGKLIRPIDIVMKRLEYWCEPLLKHVPQEMRVATTYKLFLLIFCLSTSFAMIGLSTFISTSSNWSNHPRMIQLSTTHSHQSFTGCTASKTTVISNVPLSLPSPAPTQDSSVKSITPVETNTDLTSFLVESAFGTNIPMNKSDKFELHVIGDCHVVLRPPQWFVTLKKTPALSLHVSRKDQALSYEFSTLFDGLYALKLAREDAYGVLDISIRTTKKPLVNETLQVDFGTPWLKLAGWKKAAQTLTEQVRGELHSAQSGLNNAGIGAQSFMRDTAKRAEAVLKEVEKVGLTSLNQTARTTELMIAQSKALSNTLLQRLQLHDHTITRLSRRQFDMRSELYYFTRKMSSMFAEQAHQLAQAAIGLNMMAFAEEIKHLDQDVRVKHLRKAQKKALKMWWKLRGVPPKKMAREERKAARKERMTRHHRGKKGANR